MTDWSVYVIHFDPPYKHARHYTGIAFDVEARVREHQNGSGAKLTSVAVKNGSKLIVHTLKSGINFYEAHDQEKRLKKHSAARYCPTCLKLKGVKNG